MLVTTVITHLSNSFGWVPPEPPTPPTPPPMGDDTFFEDGIFNSSLTEDGFDPENNIVTVDQSEIQQLIYEGTFKEYADNGTIVKAKVYNPDTLDNWNFINNKIEYQHYYNESGSGFGGEYTLIPIKNWDTSSYKYFNIQYSVNNTSEDGRTLYGPSFALGRYDDTTQSYILYSGQEEVESLTPIESNIFSIDMANFPAIDVLVLIAYANENNRGYNFDITKTWVSEELPAQPFWINSPGVSPVHSINGNYPYLVPDAEQEHVYDIVGDFQGIAGSTDVGIDTIKIKVLNYTIDGIRYFIPLLDSNEESEYNCVDIIYGAASDENITCRFTIDTYYGSIFNFTLPMNIDNSNKNVYTYAGADTFPLQNGTFTPVMYCGFAYIDENNIIHHKGKAIDLDYLEQLHIEDLYGLHLPPEWLTPAN